MTCSDVRGRTAVIDDIPGGVRITVRKTADNSLEHTWEIVNVDDDPEEIQLTKISRLDNEMSKATYAYADGEWTRSDNIAQSSEQVIVDDHLNAPENAFRYETRIVRDASGALLSETTVTSRRFGAGKNAVLREVSRRQKSFGDYWSYESWIDDGATYWEDDDHPRPNGRPRRPVQRRLDRDALRRRRPRHPAAPPGPPRDLHRRRRRYHHLRLRLRRLRFILPSLHARRSRVGAAHLRVPLHRRRAEWNPRQEHAIVDHSGRRARHDALLCHAARRYGRVVGPGPLLAS